MNLSGLDEKLDLPRLLANVEKYRHCCPSSARSSLHDD